MIDLSVAIEQEMVCLRIRDSGPGIPPAERERVFDRFYRADPARAHPTSDGAGLGLAITKAIVEAHGGLISVTSAQGVTCFSMVFPHSDE